MLSPTRMLIVSGLCLIPGLQAAADDAAKAAESAAQAARILQTSGAHRGICSVVGGEAMLPVELARSSELLVHVRQPNAEIAMKTRSLADQAGLGIDRLAVDIGPIETGSTAASAFSARTKRASAPFMAPITRASSLEDDCAVESAAGTAIRSATPAPTRISCR